MHGNVFASSFSASSIVLTGNTALTHNSYYAVICDNGCTAVTLPSLTLSTTSSVVNNSRMFMLKNVSAATVTISAAGGDTMEGGSSSMTLTPNQWAILHADNPNARWNVYRPDSPGYQVTDVTYAQLMDLVGATAATGTTAGLYRITDHAMAAYIIGSSGSAYVATAEPLIVNVYYNTAMGSTAQVSREAFSPLYPNDVIYYDPFPQNWIYDKSFCLNYDVTAMVPSFKGVIFYRHDLKKNIKGGYDWRHAIMRRHSFSGVTAVAFSATGVYAIGDVAAMSLGAYMIKVAGGPTGFRLNEWIDAPINAAAFTVSPENNESLSAPATMSWDLCYNDYAHSATGATFRYSATVGAGTDQLTFDSADPPSRNIDLGRYIFSNGEALLPQPSGGGPTAGAAARQYGTIVNQIRMSNGGQGSENTAFNRFNNVKLGERTWGVHFTSAGFVTGNDQQNIHVEDQCQNVTFNPYPSYAAFGATALNIAVGFKNIRIRRAVNCYFAGGMADCEIGAVRDSLFQWCSALRVGRHQNYEGSLPEYSGVLPTPPFSFSIGNVFAMLSDVELGQVRYSAVTGASHSQLGNVHASKIIGGPIDSMQVRGDFRNNTFLSCGIVNTSFDGVIRGNYVDLTNIYNSSFGHFEYNRVINSIIDGTHTKSQFAFNEIDSSQMLYSRFGAEAYGLGMTSGSITYVNFAAGVSGLSLDLSIIQTSEFYGWINNLTSPSGIAYSSVFGQLVNCEATITESLILGGLTGTTGLTLAQATVYPSTITGDMSAAVQAGQPYSKIYMTSNDAAQWMLSLDSTGSWVVQGATA